MIHHAETAISSRLKTTKQPFYSSNLSQLGISGHDPKNNDCESNILAVTLSELFDHDLLNAKNCFSYRHRIFVSFKYLLILLEDTKILHSDAGPYYEPKGPNSGVKYSSEPQPASSYFPSRSSCGRNLQPLSANHRLSFDQLQARMMVK